ncbi:OXA1 [Symbiodinium necroappetens]|uniref:OXA1 protein n=1 Tax=Symbiodinium necroappetens TaxID=1628268 RepID=A0A812LAZ0_9DINO|nr:OXA1 [Symbiodinium necroappetens]
MLRPACRESQPGRVERSIEITQSVGFKGQGPPADRFDAKGFSGKKGPVSSGFKGAPPAGIQQPPPPVNKGGEKGKRRGARYSTANLGWRTPEVASPLPSISMSLSRGRRHISRALRLWGFQRGFAAAPPAGAEEEVLRALRAAAADAGVNPLDLYQPWLLMDVLQQSLLLLHSATGDAGAAVVAAALLTRLATAPWNLTSLRRRCDALVLMPVYMNLAKSYSEAQSRRGGRSESTVGGAAGAAKAEKAEADLQKATERFQAFTQETGFNPVQGLGYQVGVVLPIGLTYFGALYGIMNHPDSFRSFVTSPSLWLDSLVLPDPYGVLPCLSALALLANAELNANPPQRGQEETAEYFKMVMRGALLTWVPWTASSLPAATFLFIATNGFYTAGITWYYRKYCWVPPKPSMSWKKR